jgi:hypothetical protein
MVFDGALADAEIGGDVLAGVAGKDHFHDPVLTRREARNATGGVFSRDKQFAQYPLLLDQLVVLTAQSRFSREGLSQPVLLLS